MCQRSNRGAHFVLSSLAFIVLEEELEPHPFRLVIDGLSVESCTEASICHEAHPKVCLKGIRSVYLHHSRSDDVALVNTRKVSSTAVISLGDSIICTNRSGEPS